MTRRDPMFGEWIVLLEAASQVGGTLIDGAGFDRMISFWPPRASAPACLFSPDRYALQIPVRAGDPSSALWLALQVWREALSGAGLPRWGLVRAEIVTPDELERETQAAERAGAAGFDPIFMAGADDLLMRALFDPVTGLPARELFLEDVRAASDRHAPGSIQAVMVLQLHGDHQATPDEILVDVGRRLSHAVRGRDRVARVGAAAFGVLVSVPLRHDVDALARRILDHARTHSLTGRRLRMGASLGVATLPAGGDADDCLEHAQRAAVEARATRGSCYRYAGAGEEGGPARTNCGPM